MAHSKPTNPQPLRKTLASLYLTTFILTLTTLSTTAATYDPTPQYPADTYPLVANALATAYTLSLSILTLLATRKTPTFHLSSALLSTAFTGLFIGITYLSRSSATLPCTAGTTSNSHNPYVRTCQLRQTVFWSAVLAAVGFAVLAVLGGLACVRTKKMSSSVFARGGDDADAVSVAPPSYQEKDRDVEAEGEWEQRVRSAV